MGGAVKSIFRAVKSVFKAPKPPKVDSEPLEDLEEDEENIRQQRRALLKTAGGASGQELSAGGTRQRNTLLGN